MYSVFPLYRDAEDWMQLSGQILLSWSIFNPNGPTINCIGIRETGARGELEVFFRWMHFLGGEDYCLGYVNADEDDSYEEIIEILEYAFSLEAGDKLKRFPLVNSVPSVVLPNGGEELTTIVLRAFVGSPAILQADWGRERYFLEKYGSQLFARAGEETREACERLKEDEASLGAGGKEFLMMTELKHANIPTFVDWQPRQYQSRELQKGDIEHWLATVSSEKFCPEAAAQFAQAWVGAIAQTELEVKTSMEEVRDFFAHFSCLWWPANWTTEYLRERMRL